MVESKTRQHLHNNKWIALFFLFVFLLTSCSSGKTNPTFTPTPSISVNQSLFPSTTPTESPLITAEPTAQESAPPPVGEDPSGLSDIFVLSLAESGHYHLFAYQPMQLFYTHLTSGDFDDRDPVISPDGTQIAFSSNRSGYWDIYILDLRTQNTVQLTSSPQYDGAPTWSPDGEWISYESYNGSNLNILIQSVSDLTAPAIQLTQDAGNNYSPAWSPAGREIAFVTDRSGACEIWTARLDTADDRFKKILGENSIDFTSPAWSPDGNQLAWTRTESGQSQVQTASVQSKYQDVRTIAQGSHPIWSPSGDTLFIVSDQPNASYFSAVNINSLLLLYSSQKLPGEIHGGDWKNSLAAETVFNSIPDRSAVYVDTPSWQAAVTAAKVPGDRFGLVELSNVEAPYPYLSDAADDGFAALRLQTGKALGWDFLAKLDDAALPLSSAPQPGIAQNWLYTGRAIAVNSVPFQANWITASREDFNGMTYWRIWVKCLKQDGSCGEPQRSSSWDFSARYSSDTQSYENGGKIDGIPSGYWIDFTSLALQLGWERLPSESNWRSYFAGTLFNQFVLRQGYTWEQSMLQLYPAEALPTSTGAAKP